MQISEKIAVKGINDDVLEGDLCQMIAQFRDNNPDKPIERVGKIIEQVMSSAGDERDFKISEDQNNIRLEVGDDL